MIATILLKVSWPYYLDLLFLVCQRESEAYSKPNQTSTQPSITYSQLTIEKLEQVVKYVQS